MTLFDFKKRTYVMGILNITPDSFSCDGLYNGSQTVDNALKLADKYIKAGCDILDIGGESTRPGACNITAEAELNRVMPVIEALKKNFSIPLSIDTTKARVAKEALAQGVSFINDVSGLMLDPHMIDIATTYQCYTIIMHSFQNAAIEQTELGGRYLTTDSSNVVIDVRHDLEKLAFYAISRGLSPDKIILDVGIGFGKTVDQNLALIANLDKIVDLGFPVLLGASRKSFIGYTVFSPVNERLGGSIAAMAIGAYKGANIVRVHDVEESIQAARIIDDFIRLQQK